MAGAVVTNKPDSPSKQTSPEGRRSAEAAGSVVVPGVVAHCSIQRALSSDSGQTREVHTLVFCPFSHTQRLQPSKYTQQFTGQLFVFSVDDVVVNVSVMVVVVIVLVMEVSVLVVSVVVVTVVLVFVVLVWVIVVVVVGIWQSKPPFKCTLMVDTSLFTLLPHSVFV